MRRTALRLLAVALLIGATVAATAAYASDRADRRPYVTGAELATDHDAHVGERAYVWTTVVAVTDDGVVVEAGGARVLVTGVTATVDPGDTLQVYGVVEPDGRIAADRTVATTPARLRYTYVVSGAAALLVAGVVLRYWRIDVRTATLRRRR